MDKFMIIGIGSGIIIVIIAIVIQSGLESKVFEDVDICKDEPDCYSARVTKIIDGDTIDVEHLSTGESIRIRLIVIRHKKQVQSLYHKNHQSVHHLGQKLFLNLLDIDLQ